MSTKIHESIDSLPYVDKHGEDEELSTKVNQIIEEAMSSNHKSGYQEATELPKEINLFGNNEILKEEIIRKEKGQKLNALKTPSLNMPKEENGKTKAAQKKLLNEWKDSLTNSKAQLEHMELSLTNQELMEKYGSNGWRYNIYIMNNIKKRVAKELEQTKESTLNIHKTRKIEQLELGDKLNQLEQDWNNLINSKLQVDIAVKNLETEIEYLENAPPPPPADESGDKQDEEDKEEDEQGEDNKSS